MRTLFQKLKQRPLLRWFLLLVVFTVSTLLGSILYWRYHRLDSFPDVGEPFDVAAYRAQYDGVAENPFDQIRKASAELRKFQGQPKYRMVTPMVWVPWEKRRIVEREYIVETDPALDLWLSVSEASKGYEVHPREYNSSSLLQVSQDSREFSRLVFARIGRRMEEGKKAEVLQLQNQFLNLNQQFRGNSLISELCAISCFLIYCQDVLPFVLQQESINIDDLQQLQQQLREYHASCPPLSENMKTEYMMLENERAARIAKNSMMSVITREDEASRRMLNLIYQNWMKHCDLPAWERPPYLQKMFTTYSQESFLKMGVQRHQLGMYQSDSNKIILQAYSNLSYTQTLFGEMLPTIQQMTVATDRDLSRRELAITVVALHIYYREQGSFPESLDALVPEYLDAVPRNRDVFNGQPNQVGTPIDYQLEEGVVKLRPVERFLQLDLYPPGEDPRLQKPKDK
ncbi:MAG: hypothetical protein KDA65_00500 [Planctomycetaceae bacterium]|nr:hypothetical protein [Planctomycetaceae bacterium]